MDGELGNQTTAQTPLIQEQPPQPPDYPSPSSPFVPPPTTSGIKVGLPAHAAGPVIPITGSDSASQTSSTPHSGRPTGSGNSSPTKRNFEDMDSDHTAVRGRGEGMASGRQRPISVPHGDELQSAPPGGSPIPRSKHTSMFSPPGSKHTPTGSQSMTMTPVPIQSPGNASVPPSQSSPTMLGQSSSSNPLGRPTSLGDILALMPDSKRSSLTGSRPAPHSPTPSRRQSRRMSRLSTQMSTTPLTPSKRRTLQTEKKSTFTMKIRDFAYPVSDDRHNELRTVDLNRPVRPPSPAPGGFLGPISPEDERTASQSESEQPGSSQTASPMYDYSSQDEEEYYDANPDAPFSPGYYLALYDFEPQAPSEMALRDQQEIQCLGRAGDLGWIVAVRPPGPNDGPNAVEHALVPEGYIEFVRAFEPEELQRAMGSLHEP